MPDWEKRASNREKSTKRLEEYGVQFESKNNGAHLIVRSSRCLIDFWPGTGKYRTRDGREGRGVFNLLQTIEDDQVLSNRERDTERKDEIEILAEEVVK